MPLALRNIVTVFCFVIAQISLAQDFDGYKGQSSYERYDHSHITPDLRGKHGVSLGFGVANVSPQTALGLEYGGHIGYNYLILKKRKRIFGIKEVTRDEVKMGFGAHLSIWTNQEWFLSFNYLNPIVSLRGKLLSVYFFNEIGVGLHRSPQKFEKPQGTKFNLSFEPFRIRFGKSPLVFKGNFYFDLGNSLLSKERMDLATTLSFRYYIYDKR